MRVVRRNKKMLDNKEMRDVYCDKLLELAKQNKDIVILEADLMKSTKTDRFFKEYPERSFDVGVAEANMMGVGGLPHAERYPLRHICSVRHKKMLDQVFISICYSQQNVKIIGTDPGIAELNGGTYAL